MKRQVRSRKTQSLVRRRRRGRRTWTSQYQVAVPAMGHDVARTSVAAAAAATRWLTVLLVVVAGWLIYWFSNGDIFYINTLQVHGVVRLSEAELITMSGLEGVNIFWVDTHAVERAIEALPEVESARVRCRLPADCAVNVVEHAALFVWRQGAAEVWIGSGGVVLPARSELSNVIVLNAAESTALKPGDRLEPALVAAVIELDRLQPAVRTYRYAEENGLSFLNDYGWPVRLGHGKDMETKVELASTLADYLWSQGIVPAFIDVRYPQAPYYGERPGSGDPEPGDQNGASILDLLASIGSCWRLKA